MDKLQSYLGPLMAWNANVNGNEKKKVITSNTEVRERLFFLIIK